MHHNDCLPPVAELGTLFDEVYEYVSARTGVDIDGLIPVTVYPAASEPCPPRGRASIQSIDLFADGSWSRGQLLGVLAHELGHVLQFRELPGIGRLGGQFTQGYALGSGTLLGRLAGLCIVARGSPRLSRA